MRMPIRICRALCCILVLSLLSGCGISSLVSRYEALEQQTKIDTNENRYMSRIILDLLNKKDLAGLKGLFCLKSESLPDIEKQISAGFQSIKGNIISFNEKNMTGYEGNSFEQGRRTFLERSWTITDIKTDQDMSYEINVYQYLIYEKDKEREGLSQITIISSDGSKLKIGYGWPSYYNDGSKKSIALIKSLSERDIAGINSLLCAKTLNIPDVNQQIQAGLNFFEGKTTDGKAADDKGRVYVGGRHSYHFYVSDSEFVEGGVPSLTYISVDIKNIETDAGKIYCIRFYSYLLNKNDKNAEGISQIIIADENGKEVSIGNKIDWLSVP